MGTLEKMALAIGFMSVFGFVALALATKILGSKQKEKEEETKPKQE